MKESFGGIVNVACTVACWSSGWYATLINRYPWSSVCGGGGLHCMGEAVVVMKRSLAVNYLPFFYDSNRENQGSL